MQNLMADHGLDLGGEGLSLLDIGPLYEKVAMPNDQMLRVFGVSVRGMFAIFVRYPEVGKWFKGGKLDMTSLVAQAPDAIAAVIAAGCALPGNTTAEERAADLPIEVQLDILEAIGRITFRSGFGPFVLRVVALHEQAASLNYGRASGMTLPQVSKPVLPPVTPPTTSGASPPVN